jgi:hypothetical protein
MKETLTKCRYVSSIDPSRRCAPRGALPRTKHTHQTTQMKLKQLLTTILAAAALTVPALAQDDTPLTQEMEKLNKAIKIVNRNLADPSQKDANLAKLAEAKAALDKAVTMEPAKAKDVPAAQKAKFVADYKAAMKETQVALEELRAAIAADKAEDAAKAMEKLNGQKKEAHKTFKKDE